MQKIKSILVPLDGSKISQKGLRLALTLAKSLDAEITGINVIRFSNGFQFPVSSEIKQIHVKNAEKIILEAQKTAKKEEIPFVGKIIKDSNIGNAIVKFAKNKKINFIIIGSRGPYPGSETFLGSVANYVLHKTNIPVTVVK